MTIESLKEEVDQISTKISEAITQSFQIERGNLTSIDENQWQLDFLREEKIKLFDKGEKLFSYDRMQHMFGPQ